MHLSLPYGAAWNTCVLLACAALLAWWQLRPRRQGPLRRTLLAVAALALAWLGLQPHAHQRSGDTQAVLLTAHADPAQRDSLLAAWPAARRYAYTPDRLGLPPRRYAPLQRLGELAHRQPALRELVVLGDGVPPSGLPPGVRLRHVPGRVQAGFAALAAPTPVAGRGPVHLGQAFGIHGAVRLDRADKPAAKVVLLDAGGTAADSATLVETAGRGPVPFRLQALAAAQGPQLWRLVLTRGTDTLAAQTLPLDVQPPRRLRIWVVAQAPNFELRFLRDALAAQGHAVLLAAQPTRGRSSVTYRNHPQVAPLPLDTRTLAKTDLLLLTNDAYAALPASQRRVLAQAAADGLGVLLLPQAVEPVLAAAKPAALPLAYTRVPALADTVDLPRSPVRLLPEGETLPATARLPGLIRPAADVLPLAADDAGRLLAAARPESAGRWGMSLLPATYRWQLAGDSAAHRRWWAHLLTALARPAPPEPTLATGSPTGQLPLPQPHAPLQLQFPPGPADSLQLTDATGNRTAISFSVSADDSTRLARDWPCTPGWHTAAADGQVLRWYVFGPDEADAALRQQHRLWTAALSTDAFPAPPPAATVAPPAASTEPVGVALAFAMLALSLGGVWAMERFGWQR